MTDMDKSIQFYSKVLGYDRILYDQTSVFEDLKALPGGNGKLSRVLLTHSQPRTGSFCRMLGEITIELIQSLDREPRKNI